MAMSILKMKRLHTNFRILTFAHDGQTLFWINENIYISYIYSEFLM